MLGNRRSSETRFHGDGFLNAKEMLAKVRPALTIVTMEGVNAPAAIRMALKAGSHVLTEKPGCTKLEQFEQLARIADPTRLTSKAYHGSWLADPKRAGGGKLIYHGIHYLDVIQQLLDDPIQEINGFTQNVGGQPIHVEDSAVMSFRFASGATGTHNTGYYLDRGKQSEIRIWGSHGWLRLAHLEGQPLEWYSTKPGAPREIQTFQYNDRRDMYHLFFQDAIDAIRSGSPPPITTCESLRVLRVVFATYQAVATQRTQRLKVSKVR